MATETHSSCRYCIVQHRMVENKERRMVPKQIKQNTTSEAETCNKNIDAKTMVKDKNVQICVWKGGKTFTVTVCYLVCIFSELVVNRKLHLQRRAIFLRPLPPSSSESIDPSTSSVAKDSTSWTPAILPTCWLSKGPFCEFRRRRLEINWEFKLLVKPSLGTRLVFACV